MSDYQHLLYDETDGVATITLNRPERMNAMVEPMYDELCEAIKRAGWNREIGVIVLAGAGDRAFCVGGDQGEKAKGRTRRGTIGIPMEEIQSAIRDVPVPVIARVQGYAIGGGNVLCTICDLTIAGESAVFGQVGPKVGSVDPGFGVVLLARCVGEKKAREMWYLCRRYTARQAEAMGLVNVVVPDDELDAEVKRWCDELLERSPTAIAIAKRAFNADTEHARGIGSLGFEAVRLYYETAECKEGRDAFREKRKPDFRSTAGPKPVAR